MRSNPVLQLASGRHRPRVIYPRGAIKRRHVPSARSIHTILQAVAVIGARSALTNHLVDGIRRARVANLPAVITARRPVMVLHQAGVPNAIVCRGDAHAPARLLHHDGQDEAVAVVTAFTTTHAFLAGRPAKALARRQAKKKAPDTSSATPSAVNKTRARTLHVIN